MRSDLFSLWTLLVLNSWTEIAFCDPGTLVNSKSGPVEGIIDERIPDAPLHVYLGVPYAKPPIGELRFKRTVPVEPWSETFMATNQPHACIQMKEYAEDLQRYEHDFKDLPDDSEDCLYLNVYSPANDKETKKPVIVFIHGGNWVIGGIQQEFYDPSPVAALGNVIVVSIQYRLSLFGLLNAATEDIPGNEFLYDMATAVEWVKENIDAFGGDPEHIVLWGHQSGAVAAGYLMVTERINPLIKRVIMQSGSPFSIFGLLAHDDQDKIKEGFNNLLEAAGCPTPASEESIACLQGKSNEEFKSISAAYMQGDEHPPYFPVHIGTDLELLKRPVLDVVEEKQSFGQVKEVLIGQTSDEGGIYAAEMMKEIFDPLAETPAPLTLDQGFDHMKQKYKKWSKMMDKYEPIMRETVFKDVDPNNPDDVRQHFLDWFSDYMVTCPNILFSKFYVEDQAAGRKVFFYEFDQKAKRSPFPAWVPGVFQFDDVQFTFGRPLLKPDDYTPEEVELSKQIIAHFTSFAKDGSPGESWPPSTSPEDMHYMLYKIEGGGAKDGIVPNHCERHIDEFLLNERAGVPGMMMSMGQEK